jgi:hypothetical protein
MTLQHVTLSGVAQTQAALALAFPPGRATT